MNSRLILNNGLCLIAEHSLIKEFGKTPAQFLQQLHYWITEGFGILEKEQRWIHNSLKEWAKQLMVSSKTIQRIIEPLKEKGVLLVKNINKCRYYRTLSYSIDYQRLKEIIDQSQDCGNLGKKPKSKGDDNKTKCLHEKGQNVQINTKITNIEKTNISKFSLNGKSNNFFEIKEKSSIPEKLLCTWNEIVGNEIGISSLTPKRAQWLKSAFQRFFNSSYEKWAQFCKSLKTSDFLMGRIKKSFKANIDWILKFDILLRIKEGQFGIKQNNQNLSSQEVLITSFLQMNEKEKRIRMSLVESFGVNVYISWFKDALITFLNKNLIIQATSIFSRNYINTHYLREIINVFTAQNLIVRLAVKPQ